MARTLPDRVVRAPGRPLDFALASAPAAGCRVHGGCVVDWQEAPC